MKSLPIIAGLVLLGGMATLGDFLTVALDEAPPAAATESATADDAFDTSRLPRVTGADEMFASAATTLYLAPDTVAKAAVDVERLLTAAGWQPYSPPNAARADKRDVKILSLKKGPVGLSVFVTVAPAQGNKTSVAYTAVALEHDLPFPPGAANIEYDPNRPSLACTTREPLDKTLAGLETGLVAIGWQLWTPRADVVQQSDRGAWRYFVHPDQSPLFLTVSRDEGGQVKVEIKSVPAATLEAENKSPPATAPPQSSPELPEKE